MTFSKIGETQMQRGSAEILLLGKSYWQMEQLSRDCVTCDTVNKFKGKLEKTRKDKMGFFKDRMWSVWPSWYSAGFQFFTKPTFCMRGIDYIGVIRKAPKSKIQPKRRTITVPIREWIKLLFFTTIVLLETNSCSICYLTIFWFRFDLRK